MAGTVTVDTIKSSLSTPTVFQNTNGTEIGQLTKVWTSWVGNAVSIRGSFNTSSVTRVATGNWSVTATVAVADTNYSTLYTPSNGASATYYVGAYPSTSSVFIIWNYNGAGQVDTAFNSAVLNR